MHKSMLMINNLTKPNYNGIVLKHRWLSMSSVSYDKFK